MTIFDPPPELREAVDRLAPPPHLHDQFGVHVANWVATSQPASDQAAPIAQKWINDRLHEAWRAGFRHGLAVFWKLLPLNILAWILYILLLKILGSD